LTRSTGVVTRADGIEVVRERPIDTLAYHGDLIAGAYSHELRQLLPDERLSFRQRFDDVREKPGRSLLRATINADDDDGEAFLGSRGKGGCIDACCRAGDVRVAAQVCQRRFHVAKRPIHQAILAPLRRVRLHMPQHGTGHRLDDPVPVGAKNRRVRQDEGYREPNRRQRQSRPSSVAPQIAPRDSRGAAGQLHMRLITGSAPVATD
jgi:hypothetical protein